MKILNVWFSYAGRLRPFDFWMKGLLPGLFLGLLVLRLDAAANVNGLIWQIFLCFSLWPASAMLVKRWHDRNKSGWFSCLFLVPVIGQIWTLIEAGFMEGS